MLQIELRQSTNLPIEVFGTCPDAIVSLSLEDVRQHKVYAGNQAMDFGGLFEISGDPSGRQQLWMGELKNVSGIGYRMESGWIQIEGDAGNYLGARMSNGTIHVSGNVGNNCASEMTGGLFHVRGNAGNDLGAAMSGSHAGQNGGTILVEGSVGHSTGRLKRRGVIAISGDVGHCCGYMMRGGTIFAGGRVGRNPGSEMVRGTIILANELDGTQAGFVDGGCHAMPVVRLIQRHLQENGFGFQKMTAAKYRVFHGDRLYGGRGELLVAAG